MATLANFVKGLSVATSIGGAFYFFNAARSSSDITSPHLMIEGKELKLHGATVIFRHGARTPLHFLPGNHAEAQWEESLTQLPPPVVTIQVTGPNASPQPESKHDATQLASKLPGGAARGQLTVVGREHAIELGQQLRNRYMKQSRLLSNNFKQHEIAVQSSNLIRTVESARYVLEGLYGRALNVPILTLSSRDEVMYPNLERCPKLAEFFRHGRKLHYQQDANTISSIKQIARALDIPEKEVHFVGLFDIITSSDTHGKALPSSLLDADLRRRVAEGAVNEMMQMTSSCGRSALQLGIGPFLQLINTNINNTINHANHSRQSAQPPKKLYLFSGHDTTLLPLLKILDIFDGQWPRYCASLSLEVLQDLNNNKQFYVRVFHNDTPQVLKACGTASTLCPAEDFAKLLDTYIPKDFASECAVTASSSSSSSSAEMAAIAGSDKKPAAKL